MATQTRQEEIEADLAAIRERIRSASKVASVSNDGHSLTYQSLESLRDREAELETQLAEVLAGPIRRTVFVRPTGLVQSYPYWRGQRYTAGRDYDQDRDAPTIAVEIVSGSPTVSVVLSTS